MSLHLDNMVVRILQALLVLLVFQLSSNDPPMEAAEQKSIYINQRVLPSISAFNKYLKWKEDNELRNKKKAKRVKQGIQLIDDLFQRILAEVSRKTGMSVFSLQAYSTSHKLQPDDYQCYRSAKDSFHRDCVNIDSNTYVMKQLVMLGSLCASNGFSSDIILQAFSLECSEREKALLDIR